MQGMAPVVNVGVGRLYSSVTNLLLDLSLPSFNTLIHEQKVGFNLSLSLTNCDLFLFIYFIFI